MHACDARSRLANFTKLTALEDSAAQAACLPRSYARGSPWSAAEKAFFAQNWLIQRLRAAIISPLQNANLARLPEDSLTSVLCASRAHSYKTSQQTQHQGLDRVR